MINRAQITRRSAEDEVPARTVERDYVLAHIIAAVSNIQEESGLIFKGGTALRLCYFEDYRYSADLDFSMLDICSLSTCRLTRSPSEIEAIKL